MQCGKDCTFHQPCLLCPSPPPAPCPGWCLVPAGGQASSGRLWCHPPRRPCRKPPLAFGGFWGWASPQRMDAPQANSHGGCRHTSHRASLVRLSMPKFSKRFEKYKTRNTKSCPRNKFIIPGQISSKCARCTKSARRTKSAQCGPCAWCTARRATLCIGIPTALEAGVSVIQGVDGLDFHTLGQKVSHWRETLIHPGHPIWCQILFK